MSDEDWYERVLDELGSDRDVDTLDADVTDADATDDATDADATDDDLEDVETAETTEDEVDDPFGGGKETDDDDPFGGRSGSEDDPFGAGSESEDDPFGGVRDSDSFQGDPFGGPQQGGEPFGFDQSEGDDQFGFAPIGEDTDSTMAGAEAFDESEFESDIDRIDIGIEGLDEMVLGGVPKRSLMTVIGGAGTGKTTFGLQFLEEALKNDQRAVFLSLEQSKEAVITTAEEKGWPFETYNEEGRLAVVSLDPVEMANSLASLRNDLGRLIEDFGADRVVLDSVSLLEMMYDHPAKRRSEVFGFTRSLKEAGVTTLLISEASNDSPYASRYGIVEYLTDAVFVLQYVRTAEFRETRMAIEIQKIRDANHSRETKPFEITDTGINVYRRASIF